MGGNFKWLCLSWVYLLTTLGIMLIYDALLFNIQLVKLFFKIISEIIMSRRITIYALYSILYFFVFVPNFLKSSHEKFNIQNVLGLIIQLYECLNSRKLA